MLTLPAMGAGTSRLNCCSCKGICLHLRVEKIETILHSCEPVHRSGAKHLSWSQHGRHYHPSDCLSQLRAICPPAYGSFPFQTKPSQRLPYGQNLQRLNSAVGRLPLAAKKATPGGWPLQIYAHWILLLSQSGSTQQSVAHHCDE